VAFATLNGVPVFHGAICIPRVGAWTADLTVDSATALTGACTLVIDGGLTLKGTAVPLQTGVWLDTARLRVVGGAGGLGKTAKPRHYRQTTARIVLQDLLTTAGEQLSATADLATLALSLPMWTTVAAPIGRMIAALLGDSRLPATTTWRVLPGGTLFVGRETWPDSGLANLTDYQDLAEQPEDAALELGVEAPRLLPGTTLGGRRVSYVEHKIDGNGARTCVYLEI
jgi:hypothetical protein